MPCSLSSLSLYSIQLAFAEKRRPNQYRETQKKKQKELTECHTRKTSAPHIMPSIVFLVWMFAKIVELKYKQIY